LVLAVAGRSGPALARADSGDPTSLSSRPGRLCFPTEGVIESRFEVRWGRLHTGIDIANNAGTPISAAAGGLVTRVESYYAYGLIVVIDHGGGISTLYAHLASASVAPGQWVKEGDLIGAMGNSGNATGTHVHFEVRVNDEPTDPLSHDLQHCRHRPAARWVRRLAFAP